MPAPPVPSLLLRAAGWRNSRLERSQVPRACQLRLGMRLHLGCGTTTGCFSMTCFHPDLFPGQHRVVRVDVSWAWKMPAAVCTWARLQHLLVFKAAMGTQGGQ